MGGNGTYRTSEIKYNIDTAVQRSMFDNDEEDWGVILALQSLLYEEFGIKD